MYFRLNFENVQPNLEPYSPFVSLSAEHFAALEQQHRESLQTSQDQKTLIVQLEADLSKVQSFLAVGLEGKEAVAGSPSSAEIISEAVRDVETVRAKITVAGDVLGGANSLLPIVSSQRERFKQRNVELEAVSVEPQCLCDDHVFRCIKVTEHVPL